MSYNYKDEIYPEKEAWHNGAPVNEIEAQRRDQFEIEAQLIADELRQVGMTKASVRYLKLKGLTNA